MRATSFSPCTDDAGLTAGEILAMREPRFLRDVDRRDDAAAGFENLRIAADCIRIVDEIEDRINALWMSRLQRADYIAGFGIVNFLGAEGASFVGVAANGGNDVCAAGASHLDRVASDPAGRAHYNQALVCGEGQKIKRSESC